MLQTFPNRLEQIPVWTLLLKTTPARISCAVCFNSNWNSGFTSQVWTEGLHIKNCGGQGCIYTRSDTRSIRGQPIWFVPELAMSFGSAIAPLELAAAAEEEEQQQEEAAAGFGGSSSSSNSSRRQQQQAGAASSSKQQQVAASSSKQQQVAASSSKQQPAASKQQASSKQAASKQQPAFAPLKEWSNISFKNQRNPQIELFPAHGLPIGLLRADTT